MIAITFTSTKCEEIAEAPLTTVIMSGVYVSDIKRYHLVYIQCYSSALLLPCVSHHAINCNECVHSCHALTGLALLLLALLLLLLLLL
jgi:hypothetical protein